MPNPFSHLPMLADADAAYQRFLNLAPFGGPSLYFHQRALKAAGEGPDQFAQAAYAMLVSWGMHRMGKGGAKMADYDGFFATISNQWAKLHYLSTKSPSDLAEGDWAQLKECFLGIRVMATRTILVSNSKVLAHALPRLVAPIDRNYTLRYLVGSTNIRNEPEWQWGLFRRLHEGFFYPLIASARFQKFARKWSAAPGASLWNTSPLKLADNLVIGAAPRRSNQPR